MIGASRGRTSKRAPNILSELGTTPATFAANFVPTCFCKWKTNGWTQYCKYVFVRPFVLCLWNLGGLRKPEWPRHPSSRAHKTGADTGLCAAKWTANGDALDAGFWQVLFRGFKRQWAHPLRPENKSSKSRNCRRIESNAGTEIPMTETSNWAMPADAIHWRRPKEKKQRTFSLNVAENYQNKYNN